MPITVRRDPYASAEFVSVSSRAKPGQAWAGWLGRGSVREQAPCRGRVLSDAQALSAPLAIVLLLVGSQAAALGLGELRVRSALHQPFQGEIELFEVERSDLDRIAARLASPAAFEQAGLERPAFLTEMRFTPMIGPDGGAMLKVISREPIREPYLALLLELRWPDGRLVKEYAVLLDPPAVGGEREQGQGQGQAEAPSRLRARPARSPLAAVADRFPLRYGPVPAGVGLTEVGRRLAMPGVTLEQIALAFYRNSPDAFVDGNINRLRQGVELIIPSRAELLALTADAAREQYWAAVTGARIAQVPLTDVDAPLTSASQEASASQERNVSEEASASQEVNASQEASASQERNERADAEDAYAEQTPVAAESPAPEAGALAPTPEAVSVPSVAWLEAELLLMREQSEASRQEVAELRARLQELEARLSDSHRLLERRNAQLAQPSPEEATSEPQSAD
ncbi:MAG: FimV family protein, partial [Halochromatium sp.]